MHNLCNKERKSLNFELEHLFGENVHVFTNNLEHNFVGSSTDGSQSSVAVKFRSRIFEREAHPAVHLHARVRQFTLQPPYTQLTHRRQFCYIVSLNILKKVDIFFKILL